MTESRSYANRIASFLLFPLPFIAYCVGIYYVTTITLPDIPNFGFDWWDKVNHLGAFFIMTVLAYRASSWWFGGSRFGRDLWIALLFSVAYGGAVELVQMGQPERSADLLDWIADSIGALLAVVAIGILSRTRLRPIVHCSRNQARV